MTPQPNPVWIHNLLYYSRQPIHRNHIGNPSNWYITYINRKITQLGELIMSKRTSSSDAGKKDWEVTFVQLKLSGEQVDEFNKWSSRKETEVALDVASFMSNGHKTSITWDDSNKCWIVSATCKDDNSKNYNHCLSSRSDDWYEAMRMNVFKHDIICNKGSWTDKQQDSNWG